MDCLSIKRFGAPKNDALAQLLNIAFDRALERNSLVSDFVLQLPGASGILYRMFINNLMRLVSKGRYLEVGTWAGSTACSAIENNFIKAHCIDNWSQFGGPRDVFFRNIEQVKSKNTDFSFTELDFREVKANTLGLFNVYLFDGPHEKQDQYDGLAIMADALDDDFIFIVDDWNWGHVRSGTIEAIRDTGFVIDYAIEVRTTQDNSHSEITGERSDWHNGYFISKLSRIQKRYYESITELSP